MWQTMETAPHDKRVMVWSGQEMYCAHWAQNPMTGDEAWIVAEWGTEGDQALVKPTHWRPLPLPPNVDYPPVLDACCSARLMWFDKKDDRALFFDKRCENFGMQKNGRVLEVAPDVQGCFTEMPFPDDTFYLVVFDPPHMKGTEARLNGVMGRQYGLLFTGWEDVLAAGFKECFRVLKPGGTLIFKWCEVEIPLSRVLALTDQKPLFGNRSGKAMNTHWVAFIKCG